MPQAKHSGAPERVTVIGLGRFGTSVAKTLSELGYEVLAIDMRHHPGGLEPCRQGDGTS